MEQVCTYLSNSYITVLVVYDGGLSQKRACKMAIELIKEELT